MARGRWGEDLAQRWYAERGYEVLDRNWRCAGGEIDLVVRTAMTVVFVEVKARASNRFGEASAAVDGRKQQRVRLAGLRWLTTHPEHHGDLRFDVVAVTGTKLEVIEAAY